MKFDIEINSKQISVELINKKSIKHCYLRILSNNLLQIKANKYFTLNDAKSLIENKRSWISKNIKKYNAVSLSNNQFYLLGNIEEIFEDNFDLSIYYKSCAKDIMPAIVEKYSCIMELYPSSLKFRNNKSRWGSCSYSNAINLNINLMKFPISVIEYVIIHELAHIQHKNHSKDFWNLVEKYCPDYKKEEVLLKSFL